jgi:hypothetical protein
MTEYCETCHPLLQTLGNCIPPGVSLPIGLLSLVPYSLAIYHILLFLPYSRSRKHLI